MVAWYKHDIPAWMNGTESLSDGEYRAYHVICQLIYLNEGPITVNEHGLAGRCNMHILAFRPCLKRLISAGKLILNPAATPDQPRGNLGATLDQPRANLELTRISSNRVNAGLGGSAPRKPLKNNDPTEAPLRDDGSLKTREEETRLEKKDTRVPALVFESDWPKEFREEFWRLFPKRVDKQAAFKKLEQLRRIGKLPWKALVAGVERYAEAVRGTEPAYIKGPAAWLNAGKWDDEISIKTTAKFDIRNHLT